MSGCQLKQMKWPGRGRQFGDLPDSFGRQFFFLLAMVTKMVAGWSADVFRQQFCLTRPTAADCFVF